MRTIPISFSKFINSLVTEKLHPEIESIIKSPASKKSKKAQMVAKLDHIDKHPLVQKFTRHMVDFDNPPYDYAQLGNMGKWQHPIDKKWHIVARDHGFNREVMDAYSDARGSARDNAQT